MGHACHWPCASRQQRELVIAMDPVLRRLFDEDDQARRDFACWEAEWARRLKAEQMANEERNDLLARLAQRRVEKSAAAADDGLIYRTTLTPRRRVPEPEATTTMDAESSKAWNEWCSAIARSIALSEATKVWNELVDDLDKIFDQRDKQAVGLQAQIDELQTRLADLEARVSDLEGGGADKAAAVIPLRGRDVA
jgi:hypothetical protein